MKSLRDVVGTLHGLDKAMFNACIWLADVAQVKNDDEMSQILYLENGRCQFKRHDHKHWIGAIKGEYSAALKKWGFFCPVWHSGQAVKSLSMAYTLTGEKKFLQSAKLAAEFILNESVNDGPDKGLILAYEDHPDQLNTSAILECLDGLFILSEVCKEPSYSDAAVEAARWCRDNAWLRGEGLVQDLYDPAGRFFVKHPYRAKNNAQGRPLADDAVWLTAYRMTKEEAFREVFYEILERLIVDENPRGNWIDYGPCNASRGVIHPRHAYWWGKPMLDAYRDSKEQRWLDAACRSGQWYINAQRADGGLFRDTYLDFTTPSFGHCTSGIVCAVILWTELFMDTNDVTWLEPIRKAMNYAMNMQFKTPEDMNLKGCILEKVLLPDGTDASPYMIRDLGTIFFIQAAALLLKSS